MFEIIKSCKKCGLCIHQSPLIDTAQDGSVFWVGLSAKKTTCANERPLSPLTNSGEILCKVEEKCTNIPMYRTNIVKCVPLDEKGKLRYPSIEEINQCLPHFDEEIASLSPKVVFLLGNQVVDAISKHYSISLKKWRGFSYSFTKYNNMYFVPIHHPSYIYVYKRKQVDDYIEGIECVIRQIL